MELGKKAYSNIMENYNYINKLMLNELKISSEHDGLTGNFRERSWIRFFRSIIPLKYSLSQGVKIIDSEENVSNEVDIAVYDEQYTPYVFQYDEVKYIPIEAVAVVIECKSTSYTRKDLKNWSESIDSLKSKPTGIARMVQGYSVGITNPTQQATRPIKVLASLKKYIRDTAVENVKGELGDFFDFILLDKQEGTDQSIIDVIVKHEDKSLGWWGSYLNSGIKSDTNSSLKLQFIEDKLQKIKSEGKEKEFFDNYSELRLNSETLLLDNTLKDLKVEGNPLITLNLQLNQLLMLINNPMLFPHLAYAKAFNKANLNL
ncbi:MAG: DUF6602 domain-containing protein [Shouchella clausii]|jgi:hypothetical protein